MACQFYRQNNRDMQNKYIEKIIQLFIESNFSDDLKLHFQKWFRGEFRKTETEEVLKRIWNYTDSNPDWKSFEELKYVHKQIRINNRLKTKMRLRLIAAIITIPIITAFSTYYLLNDYVTRNQPELTDKYVPNADLNKLILPDGTEVWLNSGSLLVYPKSFKGKKRIVYLNGEAKFDVIKNPKKPFIVNTSEITVEALGTCFNVSAYADDNSITMTLQKGKIRIASVNNCFKPLLLSPNEQVIFEKSTKQISKKRVNANFFTYWTQGHLVFQSASFDEIIKKVERYYDVTINYDNTKFRGKTYFVKFKDNESLDETLDVLKEMVIGLEYRKKGKIIYLN